MSASTTVTSHFLFSLCHTLLVDAPFLSFHVTQWVSPANQEDFHLQILQASPIAFPFLTLLAVLSPAAVRCMSCRSVWCSALAHQQLLDLIKWVLDCLQSLHLVYSTLQ